MATFLNTTGVSHYIEQLLKNTHEKLILISPYLKMNDRIKQNLQDLDRFKIDIRLVFRDNKLSPTEQNWLAALPTIRTSLCDSLHAKCYLNENEAIVTSMNLYEFSQVNNREMGIHVTKEQDPDLYSDIHDEAMALLRGSDEIRVTVSEVKKASDNRKANSTPIEGFCIRCHAQVKLNPKVPYCKDCYNKWKKKSDESELESYCHICGQPNKSTIIKPTCYKCYRSNKDKLEFPMESGK